MGVHKLSMDDYASVWYTSNISKKIGMDYIRKVSDMWELR